MFKSIVTIAAIVTSTAVFAEAELTSVDYDSSEFGTTLTVNADVEEFKVNVVTTESTFTTYDDDWNEVEETDKNTTTSISRAFHKDAFTITPKVIKDTKGRNDAALELSYTKDYTHLSVSTQSLFEDNKFKGINGSDWSVSASTKVEDFTIVVNANYTAEVWSDDQSNWNTHVEISKETSTGTFTVRKNVQDGSFGLSWRKPW